MLRIASTLDILDLDHALEQQAMFPERKFVDECCHWLDTALRGGGTQPGANVA